MPMGLVGCGTRPRTLKYPAHLQAIIPSNITSISVLSHFCHAHIQAHNLPCRILAYNFPCMNLASIAKQILEYLHKYCYHLQVLLPPTDGDVVNIISHNCRFGEQRCKSKPYRVYRIGGVGSHGKHIRSLGFAGYEYLRYGRFRKFYWHCYIPVPGISQC